ncbi:MAG: hypothetical protein MUF87_10385 [Anaerolineae bacterium]|jgi:hypothetical protein|nr:hypothetical protein [Anaerolineae bacterium]
MPVAVERIEPCIYLVKLPETLLLEDIYVMSDHLRVLINEDQAKFHVVISDLAKLKKLPFDLQAMSKTIPPDRVGSFVLHLPPIARLLLQMVTRMTGHPIVMCDSYESALTQARALIERQKGVVT